mmetsp:Transcript_17790/g.27852  ORF Transcript_17790/g.27852 Transcript_17790/m.27852 type:complete len:240 (-) Transcript_17790:89-808(-)
MAFLLTIDPSLGRVDKSTLSQKTRMELLVQDITNSEKLCGPKDNQYELSHWHKIFFDENGRVIMILWSFAKLSGSIGLHWLPSTTRAIKLFGNTLEGTVDFTDLPEDLEKCILGTNKLSGPMDLTRLPVCMEIVSAFSNRFSGSLDLTQLPDKLTELDVSYNNLSGTLDLTHLPKGMLSLSLNNNNFRGETDFSRLPKDLKSVYLSSNPDLSGRLVGEITYSSTGNTKVVDGCGMKFWK